MHTSYTNKGSKKRSAANIRTLATATLLALPTAGLAQFTPGPAGADQFAFYFNGTVSTNNNAIGGFDYNPTSNAFYTASFGSQQIRKV